MDKNLMDKNNEEVIKQMEDIKKYNQSFKIKILWQIYNEKLKKITKMSIGGVDFITNLEGENLKKYAEYLETHDDLIASEFYDFLADLDIPFKITYSFIPDRSFLENVKYYFRMKKTNWIEQKRQWKDKHCYNKIIVYNFLKIKILCNSKMEQEIIKLLNENPDISLESLFVFIATNKLKVKLKFIYLTDESLKVNYENYKKFKIFKKIVKKSLTLF